MNKTVRLSGEMREEFPVPKGIIIMPMNPETGEILSEPSEGGVDVPFRDDMLPNGKGRLIGSIAAVEGEGEGGVLSASPEFIQ